MKVKIKDLKSNPFKKFISGGRLNSETIARLKESISHGTLPITFSARKVGKENQLCFGHHRIEAFKQVHGKDFEVEVNFVDYNDEKMLVDMVRENINQRDVDYQDKKESVVLAHNWLGSKVKTVKRFDSLKKTGFHPKGIKGGSEPLEDSHRSVAKFLSKEGKSVSYETVRNYLNIHFNLDKNIEKKVGKIVNGKNKEEKKPIWHGVTLAKFKDKKEQRDLDKVIEESQEQRRNQMSTLITSYKQLPKKEKEDIREQKIDIVYAPIINKVIKEVPDKIKQVKIIERIKKNSLNQEQVTDLIKKSQNNKDFVLLKDQLSSDLFKEDWWLPEQKRPQGYGRNDYHGNCSPLLIKQGLLRYAKNKKEIIVDSMAGSGTFIDVAKEMGYKKIFAFDIYPIREDIKKKSAQDTGLKNNSVDFIFNHYPYWEMVDYSKYSNKKSSDDLSSLNYDKFLNECKKIIQHNFNILKKDCYYMVLIGDIRRQGRKFLASEIHKIAEEVGFNLWDRAVMKLQGQTIKADPNAYYRALKNNYMVQTYDDILVFKKRGKK